MFEIFRIKQSSILSKRRNADVVKARKIMCYLYHKQGYMQKDICKHVNLSKSGVKHALDSLKNEMQRNDKLRLEVENYERASKEFKSR
jgi:chromosomal replication initiation ATPase DnaA